MSYDIYLDPLKTVTLKPFAFGYRQALAVDGLTKVAQRFLKILLTPLGSDLSGEINGTRLSDLAGGTVPDDGWAATAITEAVTSAETQTIAALQGQPLGLQKASITNMVFRRDIVDVYIQLLATDGSVAELTLPVNASNGSVAEVTPNISGRYSLEGL